MEVLFLTLTLSDQKGTMCARSYRVHVALPQAGLFVHGLFASPWGPETSLLICEHEGEWLGLLQEPVDNISSFNCAIEV